MDFLKQVSIEIYPEGASDEERKSYSKKYGAQMHALLDAIRRQRQEREFSQQRNGSGKECFEEKSVRDSMMSGYESGQGKLWIVDNGKRAQELLEQGCPVLVWLHEDNRDQDFSGVRYACENISELDFDYLEKVYRRYVGIPWEILTTERCLIRETGAEDLDALYEIYADPSVTKYTEGLYPERAKEEAYLKDYTENMYYFYNYGVWTICDRMTGQVIGRGYNRRNTDKSTLAHAEITAINKASKVIGDWRLEECTLYVTLEPCQMCAGAIVQARIPEVVMGCMNPKAGCAGSILNILEMPQFNHQVKVTRGILETECSQMLKTFFEELRIRNKQEKAARKASGDLS